MEAIIKDQLIFYLISKGLISKQQHAFIKRHSTVTNLLQCTHDWGVALHSGQSVDVIYIDFSRAFDSVVHSKLLCKLRNFGISGKLLVWISAFLTYRSQCVVVEHCYSVWEPVISGIPQGSVLGPVLFILFIDDIGIVCQGIITHKLFADDLKLYSTINTEHDVRSLQSALVRLQQWCCDWQLTINVTKCHILHIGNKNINKDYVLNGCKINVARVVTDLGVDIDVGLTYAAHINRIVGKAYSRVGVLFKGFASRGVPILKRAYTVYIRPILEYASSVWSPHLLVLKHINAIERVQKRISLPK
jgi:ribonucleases P/MRP protein subunit RPP40